MSFVITPFWGLLSHCLSPWQSKCAPGIPIKCCILDSVSWQLGHVAPRFSPCTAPAEFQSMVCALFRERGHWGTLVIMSDWRSEAAAIEKEEQCRQLWHFKCFLLRPPNPPNRPNPPQLLNAI